MKIAILSLIILVSLASISEAKDFRVSSVAKTKHEALIKAHGKLPNNSVIKKVYYSGSGNLSFCFVVYEKYKSK